MDSKRQLQIGELIKRQMSTVLMEQGRYIYGDILVSITQVKMTPDLADAKIYVSIYGTVNKEIVVDGINKNMHSLKQSLVGKIRHQVRRIPSLKFYEDITIDEIHKIDALFKAIPDQYITHLISEEE